MIIDERLATYLDSLNQDNAAYLNEIEEEALSQQVPIIRKQMQNLLRFLLTLHQPLSILEVGTAVGFSALLMAEYAPQAHITTIEKYEKRFPIAEENFRKAGKEEQITFLKGDAAEILKDLDGSYDLIFMDVQMPVMNGYECSRAIRGLKRDDAKIIPIVAMTANAFADDVDDGCRHRYPGRSHDQ